MKNDEDRSVGVNDRTTDMSTKPSDAKESLKIARNESLPSGLLDTDENESPGFDCPVCLQNASFPVELPCHHIFCFLCVKGVANRSKRCALCRQDIPADFFRDPKLLCKDEIKEKSLCIFDEGYQWFYEGRNGWWQYDERTSTELEKKYKSGDKTFELLIAGFLYVIDLENMRQYRRNDQTRRRRIRRDLRNIPGVKGIAGLKYDHSSQSLRPSGDGGEAAYSSIGGQSIGSTDSGVGHLIILPSSTDGTNVADDTYLTPPAPNNTPQTPMTPADSQPGSLSGSQEDLSYHLHHLHINSYPYRSSLSQDGFDNFSSMPHINSEHIDSGYVPSFDEIHRQDVQDTVDDDNDNDASFEISDTRSYGRDTADDDDAHYSGEGDDNKESFEIADTGRNGRDNTAAADDEAHDSREVADDGDDDNEVHDTEKGDDDDYDYGTRV